MMNIIFINLLPKGVAVVDIVDLLQHFTDLLAKLGIGRGNADSNLHRSSQPTC